MRMRVLAIDPGYGRCGVAVLEGDGSRSTLLYSDCIETTPKEEFSGRLLAVGNEVARLIGIYAPECVAIEEVYFSNNQKTALQVAEVRGMLLYLAASHHLPLSQVNPSRVKIALTGEGRATKAQVIKMVGRLVHLKKTPAHDDEYDAIALGLTALAEAKYRITRE